MSTSRTVVRTDHASRYLQQLCKHWAHKFETEFTPETVRIDLPLGETVLAADAEALTIEVAVRNADDLERMKDVVQSHLERFAFRETLHFDWR